MQTLEGMGVGIRRKEILGGTKSGSCHQNVRDERLRVQGSVYDEQEDPQRQLSTGTERISSKS